VRQVRQGLRTPGAWPQSAPPCPAASRGAVGPESEPLRSTAWAQAPRAARRGSSSACKVLFLYFMYIFRWRDRKLIYIF
jgi:hypothetical protein